MFSSNFTRLKFLAAAMAVVSLSAQAQLVAEPPVPAAPVPMRTSEAANQIAEINERMSVMQAQLAQLELQAKIAAKNDEIRRLGAAPTSVDEGFTPGVIEINGIDGRLSASLAVQGGNVQTVRVGDRIGEWTVRAISIDSVTISRGQETKRLGFGSYVQPPQVAGSVGAVPLPGTGFIPPLR